MDDIATQTEVNRPPKFSIKPLKAASQLFNNLDGLHPVLLSTGGRSAVVF